ncbi:hypothetical protein [Parasitella parasitica]|uniref:Uncharacterized protein n=1 Tax=Parasitella parasitica TaxID=35722 RepID=A0A0B7N709_9FUNG|nr:hypothetical protein [Parasitella parasitica]
MTFVPERFVQIQHDLAAQARQVDQLSNASAAPANNDLASQVATINANVTLLHSEYQAMNSRFTSSRVINGGRDSFEQAQPATPLFAANEKAQLSSDEKPVLERDAQIPFYALHRNHNSVQDLGMS